MTNRRIVLLIGLLSACQPSPSRPKKVASHQESVTDNPPTWPQSAAEITQLRAHIDSMSQAQLIQTLQKAHPKSARASVSALRLAAIAQHQGDEARRQKYWQLVDARTKGIAPQLFAKVATPQAMAKGNRIAIVMPTSGAHGYIGREAQAAVLAALKTHAPQHKPLLVDTTGDENIAAQVVRNLPADIGLVIGPVGYRETLAAAREATIRGIPIATLSAHAGVNAESQVMRLIPSVTWEAREATRMAKSLGYDRVGVFAPRHEAGRDQAQAFIEAARGRRLKVTNAGFYDPSGSDIAADVKRFLKLDPMTNPRLRRHLARFGKRGWKTFSPKIDFEVLYVPDRLKRALIASAHLRYFNMEIDDGAPADTELLMKKHNGRIPRRVILLGGSGWFAPAQLVGNHGLDGAYVITRCGSGYTNKSDDVFKREFRRAAGKAPSPTAWEIRDGIRLLLSGMPNGNIPAHLLRKLARKRPSRGYCGKLSMSASGQVVRQASLLQINGNDYDPHNEY